MMNVLIEYVNLAGDHWAAWALATLLDTVALLVFIGLVWFTIRGRAAPQVGYCLFLLVPLKLLSPVGVTVPAAIARWTPSALVSEWFDGAHVFETIEGQPPVQKQIATAPTDRPAPSEARFEFPALSQPGAADSHQRNLPMQARFRPDTLDDAGEVVQSGSTAQPLSVFALAMIIWSIGVLLLLGRLVCIQLRFRARLQHQSPVDESQLAVDLRELRRRAGITQSVRVIESDDITAPAVWGVMRPTIILPRAITSTLTAEQLRWVLLHELAHIRRRDLLVVVLQRCAAILHFFNPAVWMANRIIHRLREYACDDLAVSLSDGSGVESGQAFVQILRHANRSHRGLDGALGVFGSDSRASCFLRVRRLLDSDRPIRTRLGTWSLCGLILLAVIALPQLRAASDPAKGAAPTAGNEAATQDQPSPKDDATVRDEQTFELRVVGPEGKPIPGATVELRIRPAPTAKQIRQGTFLKQGPVGAFATTDADGRLAVELPKTPSVFNVNITTPGYGPYWAGWSSENHIEPIPPRFTAELEAGWSVGGVIVDGEGKPVEGVKIRPSIQFKKRAGDLEQLGVGTNLKTDDAGKWRFDSVPASKSEVFVEISHPEFRPDRRPLTRSEFGIEHGQEPVNKIVLNRGLTVVGRITDETGNPIVGARIRTAVLNDIREAKTGDDGTYRLIGCESLTAKIVVSAKGRATDMKEVRIDSEMDPVDFQMEPGGTVRIRVLDEQGNPVAKARIFFQRWRGSFNYWEFDHVSQYADKNGVWNWNEAPLDEFEADICRPGGMELASQPLISRDEEYVFRPPAALVVSGKVIDAETKEPVKTFQVLPGVRSSESHMNWVQGERFTATGGEYRIRHTHDYFAHLIRIEANGYQAALSRDIKSNEGNVSIDFELQKGQDVAATVLTPSGAPAAGANIALGIAGSQINIMNGEIDGGSTYAARKDTDDSGQFRFPPQGTAFQLVIVHPTGYAHLKATPDSMPTTIALEAWAKVEGTFRIGKNPLPNVPITINTVGPHSYGNGLPNIFTTYYATTGTDGNFAFERVVPGDARIGRRIMLTVDNGAAVVTSSTMLVANFPAGKTSRIDLGGTGRPIVGRLQPPQRLHGKVNWNFALVNVNSYFPAPPNLEELIPPDIRVNTVKRSEWLLQWEQTEAGKAWRALTIAYEKNQPVRDASPYFTASINRDGTFRIDDMPAGDFSLSVWFSRNAAGQLQDYRFSVPPMDGNESEKQLDLGDLNLD
jgi:beta-lactamase regulating signal transducer with metallopeptidase domain/uncharacterized GH25 family protein